MRTSASRSVELGSVDGTLYGFLFKAANKSTVWYNVAAFEDAGVEPPKTWDDSSRGAKTIKASGLPAYSIGGADGWTLTDLFENIYLRTAGAEKYDQLADARDPVDRPVGQGRAHRDGEGLRRHGQHRRRHSGALQTDFPTSVTNVFAETPKAAMVLEGDFVPGVADDAAAEARDGLQRLPVPGDRRLRRRRSSAAATSSSCSRTARPRRRSSSTWPRPRPPRSGPSAAASRRRTRTSTPSVYPDPITQTTAGALGERGGLPLRPLRPPAGRVRRHRRAGPVQALPGLPEEPDRRRRDREAAGGRRGEGVRLASMSSG